MTIAISVLCSLQSYGMSCLEASRDNSHLCLNRTLQISLKSPTELQVTELGDRPYTSVSGFTYLNSVERIAVLPSDKTLLLVPTDRKSIEFASLEQLADFNDVGKSLYGRVTRLSEGYRRDTPSPTISNYKVFKAKINNVERSFLGVIWNDGQFYFYEFRAVKGGTGISFDHQKLIFSETLPGHLLNNDRAQNSDQIFEILFDDFVRIGLQMNLNTAPADKPSFKLPIAFTAKEAQDKKSPLEARMENSNKLILKSPEGWEENFTLERNPYVIEKMGDMTTEWSSKGDTLLVKGNSPVIFVGMPYQRSVRIYASMTSISGNSPESRSVESHFVKVTNLKGKTADYIATVWSDGFFTVHAFLINPGFGAAPKLVHQEKFAPEQIKGFLERISPQKLVDQFFSTYFLQAAKLLDPES